MNQTESSTRAMDDEDKLKLVNSITLTAIFQRDVQRLLQITTDEYVSLHVWEKKENWKKDAFPKPTSEVKEMPTIINSHDVNKKMSSHLVRWIIDSPRKRRRKWFFCEKCGTCLESKLLQKEHYDSCQSKRQKA